MTAENLHEYQEKAARFEILVTTTAYAQDDHHMAYGETNISADRDGVLREIEGLKKTGATPRSRCGGGSKPTSREARSVPRGA